MRYTPCDPEAQTCVRNVLDYLADIEGKYVIAGQHTQTMKQEELEKIRRVTGKEPALLGFELLSYSPNINYLDTDEECMTEVIENNGTLKRAWEWAEKKGLITFTWHWFSPLGGRSKSFFSENTDFDAGKALIDGTPENRALLSDMDVMAGILRPFCDKGIPILWRPFHEAEGNWFWWGAKGADTVKALYRLMYDRFTKLHGLHDLIWVFNSPLPETYPGDDVVDVISRDLYSEPHIHKSYLKEYDELTAVTGKKPLFIGETGILPDTAAAVREQAKWTSFMTWSRVFSLTEQFNTDKAFHDIYNDEHTITLDKLPAMY